MTCGHVWAYLNMFAFSKYPKWNLYVCTFAEVLYSAWDRLWVQSYSRLTDPSNPFFLVFCLTWVNSSSICPTKWTVPKWASPDPVSVRFLFIGWGGGGGKQKCDLRVPFQKGVGLQAALAAHSVPKQDMWQFDSLSHSSLHRCWDLTLTLHSECCSVLASMEPSLGQSGIVHANGRHTELNSSSSDMSLTVCAQYIFWMMKFYN